MISYQSLLLVLPYLMILLATMTYNQVQSLRIYHLAYTLSFDVTFNRNFYYS